MIMEFFNKYTSNTLAGSGNQTYFTVDDKDNIFKSRMIYKVFCGGEAEYSFLFSNIIDSTFADGSFSHKDLVIDSWKIHEISVGITDRCDESSMKEPDLWHRLTFCGKCEKTVAPGEFFCTDGVMLCPKKDEYLCLEISFSGGMISCHDESIIPSFLFIDGAWAPSRRHPFPSMVGCKRDVKKRIAFLGDSITQGLGTPINSYTHWNSIVAESIGEAYSYWNLGLGYGRADDAASDGAWLYKAKQNDIVVVCFGVNDILQGFDLDSIKRNLGRIVDKLSECGIKVIIQTIPPFDFEGEKREIWYKANEYIKNELSKKTEFVFDSAALLGKDQAEPYTALYGGHPNSTGCKIWGDALSTALAEYLK